MKARLILLLAMMLSSAACADDGANDEEGSQTICGGHTGKGCSDSEFCDYATDQCGAGDASGLCRAKPDGCNGVFAPVKGSDGETYSNDCQAHIAGVDSCGPA